jgi:hypothetical protein
VITLTFSAFIAAYLLVPNALFRFLLGWFVPIRVFQSTRTEEITRAVVTLFFIFWFALLLVWYVPGFNAWPCPFSDNVRQRTSDYSIVASGLYSESMFQAYKQAFWDSFWRSLERQAHFLFWYYVFVIVAALLTGFFSRRYGKWRHNRLYSWFADAYFLPHMSQWHAILTGFTFPDKTKVRADVLMTDDTLYSGEIAEYFLNGDGSLAGLFLKEPERFDRTRYLKERDSWGTTRPVAKFWRHIPSAKLYLLGPKIVNLNLNYEPQTAPTNVVKRYVDDFLKKGYVGATITIQRRAYESILDRVKRETLERLWKGNPMTSRREVVFLQGILRGVGRERPCRIRAVKVTLPGSAGAFEYTEMSIVDSDNFPDGKYELEFEGRKTSLVKREGTYIARS